MPTWSSQHGAHADPNGGYTRIDDDSPYYDVYRGPDGQIYIDWTGTPNAYNPSNWTRGSFWHQWSEDAQALWGNMPRDWQDAINHVRDTYGPESSTVHHIGYSRGGAFAEMFGGTGYGAMTNPAMPIAPGAPDEAGEDWIHNWLHNHHGAAPFTPNPSQAGIPMATPTTPGQIAVPHNVIEMFGNDNNGHSLITAHVGMPSGNSTYGGSLSGRTRFRSSYPANQTRRQTEQFGDLNAHNRVYQFYNYHGEKKQMLNEYCRGLVLSMVRIQKGVVHDYEDPIAWPYPIHQPEAAVNYVAEPQDTSLDQYLNWIEFHFKDARRDGGHYGKTLGNRQGTEGDRASPDEPLASQYQYDNQINKPTCVQLWRLVDPLDATKGKRMKSLVELADDITEIFETLAYLDTNFDRAHAAADPAEGTPHIDSLDIRPTRIMLIKSLRSGGKLTHDVIYDDEQFASSRVDVGSYTTVTIHNVSPASGDIALANDPMAADNITHVPLVGKMYTFSGSCPKVWDKHKADLHQLFNPLFFRTGRYRLPKSKIHDKDQFKSPPRGRAIWSNCIGESRIGIGPGQLKKLRMNFRIRDSLGEFWQKYRDHYLSDSRLGRTVCICLEPMIRRQHEGEPKSIALLKPMDSASLPDPSAGNTAWPTSVPMPIDTVVEYQPYELTQHTNAFGVVSMIKQLRYAFKLDTAPANQPQFALHPHDQSIISGPAFPSGGIRYYFYDSSDSTKALVQGSIVHPSVTIAEGLALCLPDATSNPIGGAAPVLGIGGAWVPAKWTDDVNRVSKGDPMMFNIQINRLLTASTRLKKFIALGADKTGIKRKWEDRLKSNLGQELFAPIGTGSDAYHDAPRDIDMFHQAGIRTIVQEGEGGNMSIAAAPAGDINISGDLVTGTGGLTQAETQSAMHAALISALPTSNGKLLTSDATAHGHIQSIAAPTVNVPTPQVTVQGGLDQSQMQAAVQAALEGASVGNYGANMQSRMQTATTAALNQATSIDIATAPAATVNVPAPNVTVQGGLDQSQMQAAVTAALDAATSIDIATAPATTVNVPAPNVTVQGGLDQSQMQAAMTAALNQATNINATVNTAAAPLNIGDMQAAVTAALNQADSIAATVNTAAAPLTQSQVQTAVTAALNQADSIAATVNTTTNPLTQSQIQTAVTAALNQADSIAATVNTGTNTHGTVVGYEYGVSGTFIWQVRSDDGNITAKDQSVFIPKYWFDGQEYTQQYANNASPGSPFLEMIPGQRVSLLGNNEWIVQGTPHHS